MSFLEKFLVVFALTGLALRIAGEDTGVLIFLAGMLLLAAFYLLLGYRFFRQSGLSFAPVQLACLVLACSLTGILWKVLGLMGSTWIFWTSFALLFGSALSGMAAPGLKALTGKALQARLLVVLLAQTIVAAIDIFVIRAF